MTKRQNSSTLLAGSAKEIITPPLGSLLYGYPSKRPAKSVHDDLTATAIVFGDGKTTAAIVSLTIGAISESTCKRAKEMVCREVKIDEIVFSVSHTHSGPTTIDTAGWGSADTDYIDSILLPKIVKAVTDAYYHMRPAEIGVGETDSKVGINRRNVREDGSGWLGTSSWGIYDSRMRVISVRSIDDQKIIATMVHFGAHGTAAGGSIENPVVTRDWSGVMTDRLEKITLAPCLFLLGAEGDVAPRLPGPGWNPDGTQNNDRIDQMLEVGGRAALDASEAFSNIRSYHVPELKLIEGEISLPYEPMPDVETANAALAELEGKTGGTVEYERGHWQSVIDYADKPEETALTYKQVIIALGDIAIVPHPFEIFQMIALRIDSGSPYSCTLSLANANGANGYLPAKEDIPRGGYEVWSARYRDGYLLTVDADSEIVAQNLKILRDNK